MIGADQVAPSVDDRLKHRFSRSLRLLNGCQRSIAAPSVLRGGYASGILKDPKSKLAPKSQSWSINLICNCAWVIGEILKNSSGFLTFTTPFFFHPPKIHRPLDVLDIYQLDLAWLPDSFFLDHRGSSWSWWSISDWIYFENPKALRKSPKNLNESWMDGRCSSLDKNFDRKHQKYRSKPHKSNVWQLHTHMIQ